MRFKTSINNKQNSSEQNLDDEMLNDGHCNYGRICTTHM